MKMKSGMMNGKITDIHHNKGKVTLKFVQIIPEEDDELSVSMSLGQYRSMGKPDIGDDINYNILTDCAFIDSTKMSKRNQKLYAEGILFEICYRDLPMEALTIRMQRLQGLMEIFSKPWFEVELLQWKNKKNQ